MFIVSLTYECDIGDIEKHLDSHIQYLERQYSKGIFLVSGRKEPRTGGIILARAESQTMLEGILAEDPFKIHGLAHYDITEFIPTNAADMLSVLIE
ncbi:GTP cyclohydrolase [Shewanella sp. VB17]|uniref:YciI family protein n=1 Tax=Shewanella sp. VB17 TaxID=2739432 RepID=UPI001563EC26|nr:YciI family protein [Shewanella sp. VB17]NRD74584.1 GTP cyclohydrolase [Shewanella sp. VB17]